jgi:hypothetical protein
VSTSTTTSDDETLQPIVGWQCFMKAVGERYFVEPGGGAGGRDYASTYERTWI